jgi:hypothetical protein
LAGFDASADTLVTWDPDGAGPQAPLLVAGGSFTIAGGVFANHIAAWDGVSWRALGAGLGASGYHVDKVISYNGDLIAVLGGPDTGLPYQSAAYRWTGSAWQQMSAGSSSIIDDLIVYNGQLIAGGSPQVGTALRRWNGSAWVTFTPALDGDVLQMAIRATT